MERVLESSDREFVDRVMAAFAAASIQYEVSERVDDVGFACWDVDVEPEMIPAATQVIDELSLIVAEERSNFRCPRCAGKMLATTHSADDEDKTPLYAELKCRRCGATDLVCVH